jgi:hypothetical protein
VQLLAPNVLLSWAMSSFIPSARELPLEKAKHQQQHCLSLQPQVVCLDCNGLHTGGRAFILYPMRENSSQRRSQNGLFGWIEGPEVAEEVRGVDDDLRKLKKSGVLGPHARYVQCYVESRLP